MFNRCGEAVLVSCVILMTATLAGAQSSTPPPSSSSGGDGWKFDVYPVLAWLPTSMDLEVNVPPLDAGGGGFEGEIVDSRFDGAFLGGFTATNGIWRIDADGLWAAVGGDRATRPVFSADVDVFYAHATAGRRIVQDLYVTAGVRRLALKYEISSPEFGSFSRKPGVWNPLIGLGYHLVRERFELHGVFEGGGFGVGAESDIGASVRADWKPFRHFGLTAGYSFLRYRVADDLAGRTFEATHSLQGPVVGIGLYF